MSSGWNIMSYNRTRMLDIKMAERAIQGGGQGRATGRACAICFKNKREEYFKNKVHRIIDKEQRHVKNILSNQEREFLMKQFTDKGLVPVEGRQIPSIDGLESLDDVMNGGNQNGLDPLHEEDEMDEVPVFDGEEQLTSTPPRSGLKRRRSFSYNDLAVFSNILERLPLNHEDNNLLSSPRLVNNVVYLPPIDHSKLDSENFSMRRTDQQDPYCLYPVVTTGGQPKKPSKLENMKDNIFVPVVKTDGGKVCLSPNFTYKGMDSKPRISRKLPPLSPLKSRNKLSRSLPNLFPESNQSKPNRRPYASVSTFPFSAETDESRESPAFIDKLCRTLPSDMASQIATRQFQIRGVEEPIQRRRRLLKVQRAKMEQNVLEDPRWRRLENSLALADE